MGEAVADDGRILEPHGRGVVGVDGPIHAGAFVGEAGRFWRWQRTVRGDRADGAGAAVGRCLGHRPEDGAVFGAWIEMRQRLASYNAVAAVPWTEASKRFLETMSATGTNAAPHPDWREAFAKWSEISNEELIRNQRTDGFLQAQKELLQAGLELRSRQDDVAEAASTMFGLPTRKDFDDVTRQLTELRREVRALARQARDRKIEGAQ
jgi:hypothetical protein